MVFRRGPSGGGREREAGSSEAGSPWLSGSLVTGMVAALGIAVPLAQRLSLPNAVTFHTVSCCGDPRP